MAVSLADALDNEHSVSATPYLTLKSASIDFFAARGRLVRIRRRNFARQHETGNLLLMQSQDRTFEEVDPNRKLPREPIRCAFAPFSRP